MGRYAQRRLRGGGPPAAAAPTPPSPVSITGVEPNGETPDSPTWDFDGDVALASSAPPQLQIDFGAGLVSPDSASQLNPTQIRCTYTGQVSASGQPWAVDTDPNPDITAPGGFVFPAAGTLS